MLACCPMGSIDDFVTALPKVELHVHLVGSASVETVLGLARRHPDRGVPTSDEALRDFYVFNDFPHFIDVYHAVSRLISEPEDIADLVRGVARDLATQNVRYGGDARRGDHRGAGRRGAGRA